MVLRGRRGSQRAAGSSLSRRAPRCRESTAEADRLPTDPSRRWLPPVSVRQSD
jgi:hypothetical protein